MKSLQTTKDETLAVLRLAVEKAIERHRRMGVPIAVWKDGRLRVETPATPPRKSDTKRRRTRS